MCYFKVNSDQELIAIVYPSIATCMTASALKICNYNQVVYFPEPFLVLCMFIDHRYTSGHGLKCNDVCSDLCECYLHTALLLFITLDVLCMWVQWNLNYSDPFGHRCLVITMQIIWIIKITAEHYE